MKCDINHFNNLHRDDDHKNNGLITKIWGGPGWIFGHAVTFGYPIEPTDEQKAVYKQYFILLGEVLPCRYCRESYHKFITEGDTALTDEVMKNRETLTKWFYKIHEAVNHKLDIDYGVTYEDVVERYESFRAKCGTNTSTTQGCVMPLDYKAFSYRKLNQLDCPIVPISMIRNFVKLAKIRGLDRRYFSFYYLAEKANGDFSILKKLDCWEYRNKFCQNQIQYMRENAIPSVESDGKWIGTPTIDELKLLLFLSSNMCRKEIMQCIGQMSRFITIRI